MISSVGRNQPGLHDIVLLEARDRDQPIEGQSEDRQSLPFRVGEMYFHTEYFLYRLGKRNETWHDDDCP